MKIAVLSRQLKPLLLYCYVCRDSNSYSQRYPNLPSIMLKLTSKKFKDDGRKTSKKHEKYLPSLATKITAPNTIYTYMEYFQKLSKAMHMEYVNITLDIGAAINANKFLWGTLEQFSNVVINIGDFHSLKENFKVILLLDHDLLSSAE